MLGVRCECLVGCGVGKHDAGVAVGAIETAFNFVHFEFGQNKGDDKNPKGRRQPQYYDKGCHLCEPARNEKGRSDPLRQSALSL
jgi:hypothetical protein